MSTPTKPSIVFCHGIWADGSCFNKLLPPLQAEGYEVICAQYGLDTNEADVAATIRTFNRVHTPASWSATPTAAPSSPPRAPTTASPGWSTSTPWARTRPRPPRAEQDKFPKTPAFGQIEVADGRVWMLPGGAACFCGDLPEEEQKVVWATAWPPSVELFSSNVPGVAWRTKPSWYIVGKNDQAVHPDLERAAAKRMGATTYEFDSSHCPMLSQPDNVLDVIRTAAAAI